MVHFGRMAQRTVCCWLLAVLLLPAVPLRAAEPLTDVGDRGPLFAVASSQDTLVDYEHDYYGQHHLVLTFVPAAFTPV